MTTFSFKLTDSFINEYQDRAPKWGYTDAGGNSIGELTFIRTYSRVKTDGTKERWWEVCRRVIEGMYSIQKDVCKENRLPWNDHKSQRSAQEAYERLFELKWTPPGRGLWMMGTDFVMERKIAAALQNCGFVSTRDIDKSDPGALFAWAMDALMLGVGIGFDTLGAEKDITINPPSGHPYTFIIEDSREGWVDSLRLQINSYMKYAGQAVEFDYSHIREYGATISGFGGTSSGAGPLIKLHEKLDEVFKGRIGDKLDSRLIVDIMNLIGTCVVSGNVRRSALLAMGLPDDNDFINLKNSEVFPERNSYDSDNPGWGWMSNNSLSVNVGQDYNGLIERIANNGEPGLIWLDVTRKYGRLVDPPDNKDYRVAGYNPCSEQPLESFETCTLVEVHIDRIDDAEDLARTLKFAYLDGKTVTLLSTHWPRTNAVMQRNRRVGTSLTGIAGYVDKHGLQAFREMADTGYKNVQHYDKTYSEWLGIRESIRTTTVKPSGSVSLLSGSTPGVHWSPGGEYFMRAIRFSSSDPALAEFVGAGYTVEDDIVSANTSVVYFPIKSNNGRSEKDVSIFEKINLAAEAQRYWSDNGVSVTVSFDPEKEAKDVETVLRMYEGALKAVSFLPMGNKVYPQMPYTQITKDEYESYVGKLGKVDTESLYLNGQEPEGDRYCTTDVCEIAPADSPIKVNVG